MTHINRDAENLESIMIPEIAPHLPRADFEMHYLLVLWNPMDF
jgi:hypothetical protein